MLVFRLLMVMCGGYGYYVDGDGIHGNAFAERAFMHTNRTKPSSLSQMMFVHYHYYYIEYGRSGSGTHHCLAFPRISIHLPI